MYSTPYKRNRIATPPSSSSPPQLAPYHHSLQSAVLKTEHELQVEHQNSLRRSAQKLKASWEDICRRFGRDFEGEDDVIDLATGQVIVDNGHLNKLNDHDDAEEYLREDESEEEEGYEEEDEEVVIDEVGGLKWLNRDHASIGMGMNYGSETLDEIYEDDPNNVYDELMEMNVTPSHRPKRRRMEEWANDLELTYNDQVLKSAGEEDTMDSLPSLLPTPPSPQGTFDFTIKEGKPKVVRELSDQSLKDSRFSHGLPSPNAEIASNPTRADIDDNQILSRSHELNNSLGFGLEENITQQPTNSSDDIPSDDFILNNFGALGPEMLAWVHRAKNERTRKDFHDSQQPQVEHILREDSTDFEKMDAEHLLTYVGVSGAIEEVPSDKKAHIVNGALDLEPLAIEEERSPTVTITPAETIEGEETTNMNQEMESLLPMPIDEIVESPTLSTPLEEDFDLPEITTTNTVLEVSMAKPKSSQISSPAQHDMNNQEMQDVVQHETVTSHLPSNISSANVWDALPDDPFLEPHWRDRHPDGEPDEEVFTRRRVTIKAYQEASQTTPTTSSYESPRRKIATPRSKSSLTRLRDTPQSKPTLKRKTSLLRYSSTNTTPVSIKKEKLIQNKEGLTSLYTPSPSSGKLLDYISSKKRKPGGQLKPDDDDTIPSTCDFDADSQMDDDDFLWDLRDYDIQVLSTRKRRKTTTSKQNVGNDEHDDEVSRKNVPTKTEAGTVTERRKQGIPKIKTEEKLTGFKFARCGDIGYRCAKSICMLCLEN